MVTQFAKLRICCIAIALHLYGVPRGNRTPVVGSKILSPRPLDDGDNFGEL